MTNLKEGNMELRDFRHLDIDWNMTNEDAVTMYLEWGNNNWHAQHQPVRSRSDFSNYFVVNNWYGRPRVYLIRRNLEEAQELIGLDLPDHLAEEFIVENGHPRGVFEPTEEIKDWIRHQMEN